MQEKVKKNSHAKFPEGYLFKLSRQEYADLRSKILISSSQNADKEQDIDLRSKNSTSSWGGNRVIPTAFTGMTSFGRWPIPI